MGVRKDFFNKCCFKESSTQSFENRVRKLTEEGETSLDHYYTVTRRGTCNCNLNPVWQCGIEGQSIFSWEISAHVRKLDKDAFAIDNGELLNIANQYDTHEVWTMASCEALCNGFLMSLINRCKELGHELVVGTAKISPNQFVDIQMVWQEGDELPNPLPYKLDKQVDKQKR